MQKAIYSASPAVSDELKVDLVYHVLTNEFNPKIFKKSAIIFKKQGVDSIHFDFRWDKLFPTRKLDQKALLSYIQALKLIFNSGMKDPTIILSNPPTWVIKLYSTSKKAFFREYRRYITVIKNELEKNSRFKIRRIQVFNELNNPFYTPIEKEDLLSVFVETRVVFFKYNPNIKLILSLLVGNLTEVQSKIPDRIKQFGLLKKIPFQRSIWEYLDFFKEHLAIFDITSICHYPGVWNLPIKDSFTRTGFKLNFYKEMIGNLEFLRQVFEQVSLWNMPYEIGEIGYPTNIFWGNEGDQVEAYRIFTKEIKNMLEDFKKQGIITPSRITFYEANDDYADSFEKKLLRLTPYPEYDWGLMKKGGKLKRILKNGTVPSEFSRIIRRIKS